MYTYKNHLKKMYSQVYNGKCTNLGSSNEPSMDETTTNEPTLTPMPTKSVTPIHTNAKTPIPT